MTKDEWQSLYDDLDRVYTDFLLAYPEYENGRNKKIREAGRRKVDNAINSASYFIRKNGDAYKLLTGGEGNSDFGRTIAYDEFIQPRYFRNDMGVFLRKIKEGIQNLS